MGYPAVESPPGGNLVLYFDRYLQRLSITGKRGPIVAPCIRYGAQLEQGGRPVESGIDILEAVHAFIYQELCSIEITAPPRDGGQFRKGN